MCQDFTPVALPLALKHLKRLQAASIIIKAKSQYCQVPVSFHKEIARSTVTRNITEWTGLHTVQDRKTLQQVSINSKTSPKHH